MIITVIKTFRRRILVFRFNLRVVQLTKWSYFLLKRWNISRELTNLDTMLVVCNLRLEFRLLISRVEGVLQFFVKLLRMEKR